MHNAAKVNVILLNVCVFNLSLILNKYTPQIFFVK